MRERMREVAAELLIRHGFRGLRLGEVAERVGTVRANVHYHFGTKQRLVEEVVVDYVERTLLRFRQIWQDETATLEGRIRRTMAFNRERHRRFNPAGEGGKPWSLIARMRLERELLSEATNAALRRFALEVDAFVTGAVEQAKARGELRADAPVADIALQLAAIANSSGSISQDTGSFAEVERLYLAVARVIQHAYGQTPRPEAPLRGSLVRAG
jgi:TetR/AcrR family transcriptional regulator, transcriptional repressor for nem operon